MTTERITPPINQRLLDLVRFCRHKLFDDDLITKEEFAELARQRGAVQRLEDYDVVRMEAKNSRAAAFNECIELLEARKRFWDGGDLARHGEYANFVKELDRLIEQFVSVRDADHKCQKGGDG